MFKRIFGSERAAKEKITGSVYDQIVAAARQQLFYAEWGVPDTPLGRRDVPWCYHALAMWMEPDEETAQAHIAWARGLAEDLEPHVVYGVYLNYTSDEGEDRVRSSYGEEKYARLVALKDRYDPGNLFHLNQNIRPSGG